MTEADKAKTFYTFSANCKPRLKDLLLADTRRLIFVGVWAPPEISAPVKTSVQVETLRPAGVSTDFKEVKVITKAIFLGRKASISSILLRLKVSS